MSESPLNFESITRPGGVCARRSAIRSLPATTMPAAPTVLMKSLRVCDMWILRRRRYRRHVEVFDPDRGHQRGAGPVVRLAGVHRHALADGGDVVEADQRRHVPAEVL